MLNTGNKPVINEKVIFLSVQCPPDIRLMFELFVESDILRQTLLQHAVQLLCLRPLVVNDHVDHILQTPPLQLLAQAVHPAQRREIRNHESKNQLLRNNVINKAFLYCLFNKQNMNRMRFLASELE